MGWRNGTIALGYADNIHSAPKRKSVDELLAICEICEEMIEK